jgi:mono/diheme cytochrome c family protein
MRCYDRMTRASGHTCSSRLPARFQLMRRLVKLLWHLAAICGVVAIAVVVWFWSQGIGTRASAPALETRAARLARHAMIPAAAGARTNPEPTSDESLRLALEHWADHCAICHANDGSGETEMGQGLYPRAPDMRLPATQELSDGELFYIIENGVKLTGMPAWSTGTTEGERDSWHLVQFIRHLPSLTEAELAEMEELNPRTVGEWRALEEERRFLSGESASPPNEPREPSHRHKGVPQ